MQRKKKCVTCSRRLSEFILACDVNFDCFTAFPLCHIFIKAVTVAFPIEGRLVYWSKSSCTSCSYLSFRRFRPFTPSPDWKHKHCWRHNGFDGRVSAISHLPQRTHKDHPDHPDHPELRPDTNQKSPKTCHTAKVMLLTGTAGKSGLINI